MCIAAIAVATAAAGCGGGDDGGGGATASGGSSLSRGEFIAQANAICTTSKKRGLIAMGVYVKKHEGSGKARSALLTDAIQAVFLPEVQSQIDDVRALGAPAGDEEQVEDFLAAMQEGVDNAGKGSDPSNTQFAQSFKHSAELGHEYGVDACSYG